MSAGSPGKVALLAAVVISGCVTVPGIQENESAADETTSAAVQQVVVEGAWIAESIPGTEATAAYMRVRNGGAASTNLLGVETRLARTAQVHEMSEDDGMMRMQHRERVAIEAGATLDLEPGGVHLMLIDLRRPLSC